MIRTQYTIRPTVMTVDTRAAADACNRELASAGDTFDRRAVEKKLAVSIHAPVKGATVFSLIGGVAPGSFNPRAREGRDAL